MLTKSGLNTKQAVERIRNEVESTGGGRGSVGLHCQLRARIHQMSRYAMIAGNGRFPLLASEAARTAGDEVVAIGIREEASPEIEQLAARCHWISLGQLSRLIEILKQEQITEVMMAGQVKHASIFSSIRPDWRLFKLLASLKEKNTDALIGGVAKVLADEGIQLADSTLLLKPLLAGVGVLTKRKPSSDEERDIRLWAAHRERAGRSGCRTKRRDRGWRLRSQWKPWKAPTPCWSALLRSPMESPCDW